MIDYDLIIEAIHRIGLANELKIEITKGNSELLVKYGLEWERENGLYDDILRACEALSEMYYKKYVGLPKGDE